MAEDRIAAVLQEHTDKITKALEKSTAATESVTAQCKALAEKMLATDALVKEFSERTIQVEKEVKALRELVESLTKPDASSGCMSDDDSILPSSKKRKGRTPVCGPGAASNASHDTHPTFGEGPSKQERRATNEARLWWMGFPRELSAVALKAFAEEQIKPRMASEMWDSVKVRAFSCASNLSVDFPSKEKLDLFLEQSKEKQFTWVDHLDAAVTHAIRVRRDRSLETRQLTGFLTALWKQVKATLTTNGNWDSKNKLGTTGKGGVVYIQVAEDCFPLFKVRKTSGSGAGDLKGADSYVIKPCVAGLLRFGVDEKTADAMIAAARADVISLF